MHTNTFCKYRKKLLASPRVHLVSDRPASAYMYEKNRLVQNININNINTHLLKQLQCEGKAYSRAQFLPKRIMHPKLSLHFDILIANKPQNIYSI